MALLGDRLMPEAMALAARLASGPAALGLTRQLISSGLDADWAAQLDAERAGQHAVSRTADFLEGLQAFFQKRPPTFTGR
jgi:2-(1,2-epoxy-1,2-dihydrophenyl)acetyl-CoA isomerase